MTCPLAKKNAFLAAINNPVNFPRSKTVKDHELGMKNKYRNTRQIVSKFLKYCIVASTNPSCTEIHAGFFILLKKGIFDPYVL